MSNHWERPKKEEVFFSSTLRTLDAAFINVLLNCSEQKILFCYNCKDVIFTSVDDVFEDFAQVNSWCCLSIFDDGKVKDCDCLMLLLSERAAFCQPCPSSCGLTQNCGATNAKDDCLSVTENCCDLVTPGAFHVHEVGVGVLHQALQLVLAFLILWSRVQ